MNDCIAQCGIRHVLTSRRVMERFNLKLDAELVYLEDCLGQITLGDKLRAAAAAWLAPVAWLERRLGLTKFGDDDLLTVIFTSGSTGRPKGVMLTQRNVGSNVAAVDEIIRLGEDDVLLGILPILSLLRLYGHAVDRADVAAQGNLPLQSAGSPRGGQTLPQIRRDDHDRHAHLRAVVPAALRTGGFRHNSTLSSPGPKSSRPKWPTLSRNVSASGRWKAMAPPNCRRWSRPTFRPAAPAASDEGNQGRAPSAGPCPASP